MAALFDTIHDNALSKRAEPATLAEFVEFGLNWDAMLFII